MTIPKRPRDPNQLAKFIVDAATSDEGGTRQPQAEPSRSPAQEFARSGGLKGGRARADSLTSEQRRLIAQKAAASRWKK